MKALDLNPRDFFYLANNISSFVFELSECRDVGGHRLAYGPITTGIGRQNCFDPNLRLDLRIDKIKRLQHHLCWIPDYTEIIKI